MRSTLTGVIVTILFVIIAVVWLASRITVLDVGPVTVPGMPASTEPASLLSIIAGGIADAIGDAVRALFGGWFGWT